MFSSELDQISVLMVVIWVEGDLPEVSCVSQFRQEDACLVYSGSDRRNFQDFPEMVNSEIADTDAPVKADASNIGEMHQEYFGYLVSPSF